MFKRFRNYTAEKGRFKLMSRHPFAVPFITFGVLAALTLTAYLVARQTDNLPPDNKANIVIISHDKKEQIVPSDADTVGDLLKKLNIKLDKGDIVEPAQTARIDQDQFRVNIYRAKPVEIVDGADKTFTYSASKTPRSVAQQAGIALYPEDSVQIDPVQDFLKSTAIGEQVVIKRATLINIDLYGTPLDIRTQAKTVSELIKERGIKLIKNDQVVPAIDTPIAAGQKVSFIRTGIKTETITENIAMPVQSIPDGSLSYGTTAIRQQGSPGQQVVTYEIAITNNVETSRKVIQKVVTKQPVQHIAVVGTSISGIKGDMAKAGIAPGDYTYADYIISHESGWCPTKAQGQYGRCPPYAGSVPSTGGYGLCQSTPGSKMASAGADWATNPVTQLRWCSGYAKSRYGSWSAAYNFWLKSHYW